MTTRISSTTGEERERVKECICGSGEGRRESERVCGRREKKSVCGEGKRERERGARERDHPFHSSLQPFFEELDDCDREFDKRNKVCL